MTSVVPLPGRQLVEGRKHGILVMSYHPVRDEPQETTGGRRSASIKPAQPPSRIFRPPNMDIPGLGLEMNTGIGQGLAGEIEVLVQDCHVLVPSG